MKTEKETGSYYTPSELVRFMIWYLKKAGQDFSSVLEPAAGDGRFLSELLPISREIKAVELFEKKVEDIKERYQNDKLEVTRDDFLDYAVQSSEKFSLIIGNPPYIRPKFMDKEKLDLARKLCEDAGLQKSVMQNMWLAFVVGAMQLLAPEGSIFFVLPMEFLQVQYAEILRAHLEKKFNTIHILSFHKRVFPEIEQGICLVYLTNREPGIPYIRYEVYADAESRSPVFCNKIQKNKPLKKWSNAILEDKDISLLKEMSGKYKKVKEMGESAPGIVTGGNKFFVLTETQVREFDCAEYVLPILQKSSYIENNTIIIDENMLVDLQEKQKPIFLLNLSNVEEKDIPAGLWKYLEKIKNTEAGGTKLSEHYKCANRKPWYGVPIVNKGDVIFFRRFHIVPRVYVNQADVHTTDAGYHIQLNETLDKGSFVFCFYNSLTLAQCEFQGRYYGGGVCELTPSEFKELTIPYHRIPGEDIKMLDRMFREKRSIEDIVSFVNSKTIGLDIEKEKITEVEEMRRILIERRKM